MNWMDLIEDYLDGDLPQSTRSQMEEAMATDRELLAAVEAQRELRARLEGMRLRRKVNRHMTDTRGGWHGILGVGIAATVLLLAGLLWWNLPENGSPDPALPSPPSLPTDPSLPARIDEPLTTDSVLEQPRASAPSDTPTKNASPLNTPTTDRSLALSEAIAALDAAEYRIMSKGNAPMDTLEGIIRRSVLALQRGDLQLAEKTLLKMPANAPELFLEEAEWLLALTWLSQGKAKGVSLLSTISSQADHAYRISALQLEQVLDRE